MTRQERVERYMEVLRKEEKVNSVQNYGILERLSDEELYDDAKIAECMQLIDKIDARMENNPNKYPEEIMQYVRQRIGLDKYDDSEDVRINLMTPNEVFEAVCEWKGLLGYADIIQRWIEQIYGIKLSGEI